MSYNPSGTTGKVATTVKLAVVDNAGIVIVVGAVEPIRVGNAILLN
jgi:ribosomal protein S28E/S33